MGDALLAVGIAFTVGHVACDLWRMRDHVRHVRDWFAAMSAAFLIGHVTFTGELVRWLQWLPLGV